MRTSSSLHLLRSLAWLGCALLLPGTALAAAGEPVGHAVSVRGSVFAQSPGEERRILKCRDPLYDGDRVFTLEESDVGIDAGSYHVRIGESSEAEVGRLSTGARLRWPTSVTAKPLASRFLAMPCPISPTPMKPIRCLSAATRLPPQEGLFYFLCKREYVF